MKRKIYISGKITGLDLNYAKLRFKKAQNELEESYEVINPMEKIEIIEGKTWKEYLIDDIKLLLNCDYIFMLSNWRGSRGARLEHHISEKLGIKIIYQN